jgi:hypothetical protein
MSVTDAIQAALISGLKSDPILAGMVGGRIYDRAPSNAAVPYVSLGPEDWTQTPGDCLRHINGTIQLDVWSRKPGRRECKAISDRLAQLVHEVDLVLSELPPAFCLVTMRRILDDPDGVTTHGVVQVQVSADGI